MFTVIANVLGTWSVEKSGISRDEANQLCDSIIIESLGGDAVIVTDETAESVVGTDCSDEWNFEFFNPPIGNC